MVYTLVLETSAARIEGSTPSLPTNLGLMAELAYAADSKSASLLRVKVQVLLGPPINNTWKISGWMRTSP
jgi:hypothetical protein